MFTKNLPHTFACLKLLELFQEYAEAEAKGDFLPRQTWNTVYAKTTSLLGYRVTSAHILECMVAMNRGKPINPGLEHALRHWVDGAKESPN